jgi:hypothetical protein
MARNLYTMNWRKISLFLALLLFVFLATATVGWNRKFTRGADIAGWTASTAVNARAMIDSDRWLPFGIGYPLPELEPLENLLYMHQSPMTYYITAAAFSAFGPTEAVSRLIPLLFTVAAGFVLYRLLARLWDAETGLLGLFAFWMSPTIITFGMSNNHIVISLFTVLLAVYLWCESTRTNSDRLWFAAVACTVLAMWSYWHAYFLPLIFALGDFRSNSARNRHLRIYLWLALPVLSAGTHLLSYYLAYPAGPAELLATALNRSGLQQGAWKPWYTLKKLIIEAYQTWHILVTFFVLAFWGWRVMSKRVRLDVVQQTCLLALGACAVLYWLIMAGIAAVEPMFNILIVTPFLATCFARGVRETITARFSGALLPVLVLPVLYVLQNQDQWQDRLFLHRNAEAVQLGQLIYGLTKKGDVVFEDGSEAGPGVLAYYARGRAVINTSNFLIRPSVPPIEYVDRILRKISKDRGMYLVTSTVRIPQIISPERFAERGYQLHYLQDYSGWTFFRISRRGEIT